MWNDWSPATCLPDGCFCEALHDGAIRQPSNTWSSLAFCLAGLVMVVELWRRPSGRFSPLQAGCLAAAAVFVGATSAFYHASLTFLGQWLDVESMYLLALVGFAANVDALRPGAPKRFLPLYVGLNVVMGVLLLTVPVLRRYAFAGAILAIIVTEVLLRTRKLRDWSLAPLFAAVGLMAAAFGIWILDITRTVCAPQSWLQGHSVWHVLGACATYCLWRYYRGPQTA